jgi:diacylglycerol kinase (ATP)
MTENLRTLVIANPMGGGGAIQRRWGSIADTIRRGFGPFEHRFTERPGHGRELARAAIRDGVRQVVALGGDGTISEVSGGFLEGGRPIDPEAVLGVLPYGTGGDFRKTMGLGRDLFRNAAARKGRRAQPLDLGLLRYTRLDGTRAECAFANIASFGMGGLVDRYVNQSSKVLGGLMSFLGATVRASLTYRNQAITLSLDEGPARELRMVNVAVANGRYFGGGMYVAPHARIDDGLFDVVVLGDFSSFEMARTGYRIYLGSHLAHPKVTCDRARVVEARPLHPDDEVLLDVDGETPGRLPARFEILPSVLRLKVAG